MPEPSEIAIRTTASAAEGSPWERYWNGVLALDDTSFIKPTRNLFCDSAQSWVPLTQDTQNFPGQEEDNTGGNNEF